MLTTESSWDFGSVGGFFLGDDLHGAFWSGIIVYFLYFEVISAGLSTCETKSVNKKKNVLLLVKSALNYGTQFS